MDCFNLARRKLSAVQLKGIFFKHNKSASNRLHPMNSDMGLFLVPTRAAAMKSNFCSLVLFKDAEASREQRLVSLLQI